MIVRRCPDCGLKYDYPHGEPDPHDCKGGKVSPFAQAYAERVAGKPRKLLRDVLAPEILAELEEVKPIIHAIADRQARPGWSEERRAKQRAHMNKYHEARKAEARARASATAAADAATGADSVGRVMQSIEHARAVARAKVEEETFNIAKTET